MITYGEWGEVPLGTTSEDGEFSVFKLTYKNGHKFKILRNNIAQRLIAFESGMGIQEFKFPSKYFKDISELLDGI